MKRRLIASIGNLLFLFFLFQSRSVDAEFGSFSLYLPVVERMNPWQEVGTGSASGGGISNNTGVSTSPVIAVAPDNSPYVTWIDYTSGGKQIYVRHWNGSLWDEVGLGSASGGGISQLPNSEWPDVAVASDGTPYITWDAYGGVAGGYEIYVRRFDGSDWVEVGPGSAGGGGISNNPENSLFPSIAIASDNTPYIAWQDYGGGIYVRRWNGITWEEVGVGSASGGGISNTPSASGWPSIAIAPDGTPYVAWQSSNNGVAQIYVRSWNGSDWVEVGTGSASGGGISNTSTHSTAAEIAIAPNGSPYIVWQNQEGWFSEGQSIYIRQWNGFDWIEVGTGSASGYGISLGIGSSTSPSIAIAPTGNVYVAWGQSDFPGQTVDIYVRRWNGNSWEEAGLGSASGGGISVTGSGDTPAIAAGIDGIMYAAWMDFDPTAFTAEIYVRQYSE